MSDVLLICPCKEKHVAKLRYIALRQTVRRIEIKIPSPSKTLNETLCVCARMGGAPHGAQWANISFDFKWCAKTLNGSKN